jgi:hypothetical protein
MHLTHLLTLINRLRAWVRGQPGRRGSPELMRAQDLLRAVDAGGVPLYPGRVNAIAHSLGLEVSTKAPVEQTIERIRQAVGRAGG